jgi:hypothetical protein
MSAQEQAARVSRYKGARKLRILAIEDGFDLVRFRLDGSPPDELLISLAQECASWRAGPLRQPHQFRWRSFVEVVRPSQKWCTEFARGLSTDVAAELYEVEVARDLITLDRQTARRLHRLFAGAVVLKGLREEATPEEGTTYHGRRGRPVVLAAYSDRPHKGVGEHGGCPCFHAELRIKGKPMLKKLGFARPGDLVSFDFDSAWNRQLRTYTVPGDLRTVGAVVGDGRRRVGDHALRKRARLFRAAGEKQGWFFLQNAAIKIARPRVAPLMFSEWIRAQTTDRTLLI